MITDKFNLISNGTQPLPAQLSAQKNVGATTASLGSATGWDTSTAKHIRMYQTKVVNGQTVPDPTTVSFYKATISGTTLSDLSLIWSASGSDQQYPAGATVDLAPNAGWADDLIGGILTHADQDGTLKAGAVDVSGVLASNVVTYPKLESELQGGWNSTSALPAITTVVANGNRSYTLTHASSIASVVSPGMRRRFTRTVAANTYMGGAFNGSSHYFTKTSPSGTLGTVTNNFTIEVTYQPTSYQEAAIASRSDAAGNNSIILKMTASGTVILGIQNGGAGNYRLISTYQSLPLNKKTTIAGTWASGTVTISFDGISVPVQTATTAGTAPTTAGTGGDFSIGRKGASSSEYAPGYISNVAVFDAVLSASTIKQHATYKLTGSETNCIGAWSLDNTANDQSSAGNNLTATGGVGFTNKSPFGNDGVTDNLEYGLTMSVSSDGLTEVVQVPEGCALPTTGGITASAYSSMANPYGFVGDKGRWEVGTYVLAQTATSGVSAVTWYNPGSTRISVPVGNWEIGYSIGANATGGATTTKALYCNLSQTAAGVAEDLAFTTLYVANPVSDIFARFSTSRFKTITSTTLYYLNLRSGGTPFTVINLTPTTTEQCSVLYAIPSGL